MLNDTELSMSMQRYTNNAVAYLKQKGHLLPTLVILNKGAPLDIQIKHKHILEMEAKGDDTDLFDQDDSEKIYEYGIAFKLDENYRDSFMNEVAAKIARRYKPDAIGALSACLFKDYQSSEEFSGHKVGDIQWDPEAVRVIYSSYYLKGTSNPNYMLIPYLLNKKEDTTFGDDNEYDLSTINSSWKTGDDKVQQILNYPYK